MIKRIVGAVLIVAGALGAATPEPNAAGDIPDTQRFVTYRSAARFAVDVPEGWARSGDGRSFVRFEQREGSVEVRLLAPAPALTESSVRSDVAKSSHGAAIDSVRRTRVGRNDATAVRYHSTGSPNAVTGRAPALDDVSYYIRHGHRVARLTLAGPRGADNADQWQRIAQSFTWR